MSICYYLSQLFLSSFFVIKKILTFQSVFFSLSVRVKTVQGVKLSLVSLSQWKYVRPSWSCQKEFQSRGEKCLTLWLKGTDCDREREGKGGKFSLPKPSELPTEAACLDISDMCNPDVKAVLKSRKTNNTSYLALDKL